MLMGQSSFYKSIVPQQTKFFSAISANINRFIIVDAEEVSQKDIRVKLHMKKSYDIVLSRSDEIRKLHDILAYDNHNGEHGEKEQAVNHVEFYNIQGHRIPLCETVRELIEMPVIMQINHKSIVAINFNTAYGVANSNQVNDDMSEENYYDFAKGIGLPPKEKFLYSNFSQKLQQSLKEKNSKKDVALALGNVLRYYQSTHEKVPSTVDMTEHYEAL